jgi:hypothetical protein
MIYWIYSDSNCDDDDDDDDDEAVLTINIIQDGICDAL